MPTLPGDFSFDLFQVIPFSFAQSQSAASQSAVALKLNVNAATSGSLNITGIPAAFAGSIVGLSVVLTANKTAGGMTLTPTINGTAITAPAGLVAVPVANTTASKTAFVDAQSTGARFKVGDLIGVKLTTDGSYLPITNDLYCIVYVLYEAMQL